MHFKTIKVRANIVLSVPCLELGAFVGDTGTCSLACRAGGGEKQRETHSEACKLPKISIPGDSIGT